MGDDSKNAQETWLPDSWTSRLPETPRPRKPIQASSLHYAGIENPYSLGAYGVEENASLTRRYEFIHRQLVFIQAGHLPKRSRWELKIALGKHLYEDSEAATAFRARALELRQNPRALSRDPDQRLTLLMGELLHANSDAELLVGIYEVIKPALFAAYKAQMKKTQQLADQPTIRMLRQVCWDLEAQLEWGASAIAELVDGVGKREVVGEFQQKLTEFLRAAGGVDGQNTGALPAAPRRWRSHNTYSLPHRAVRDERFPGTVHYRDGAPDYAQTTVEEKLYWLMRVRQEEMEVPELLGAVIWQQQNQPWEFIRDAARHLWDESRHAMLGQAALEAEGIDWMQYPQHTSIYDVNVTNLPAAAYVWLSMGIEAKAMAKTGKRAEYEFARDVAKHPLFAQFNDYDWADEVVHAHFGHERGPELYDDERDTAKVSAEQAVEEWREVRDRAEIERPAPVKTTSPQDEIPN